MTRRLLFSITKKDFDVQTFRAGGHGGQNQNKVESGVRIIHRDSGAVGECRETPDQHKNKKTAFRRLVETSRFKAWHKIHCSELLGQKTVEEIVEEQMHPKNLRVEVKDAEGKRWVKGDIVDEGA
jgi:peptide chain release factor 1